MNRILVIDDLCGRHVAGNDGNHNRWSLCRQFRLRDITGDQPDELINGPENRAPAIAEAFFIRGQQPPLAQVGVHVRNDLDSIRQTVRSRWPLYMPGTPPWAMVLLDLNFIEGMVTAESHEENPGMPPSNPSAVDNLFGMDVLRMLTDEFKGLPVVILSGEDRSRVHVGFNKGG